VLETRAVWHEKESLHRGDSVQRSLGWPSWWLYTLSELLFRGWRDGSAVKTTDCSSRGHEFNSQQPHDGSQLSAMGFFWCVWRQWWCTHIHKIINKSLKKKEKEKKTSQNIHILSLLPSLLPLPLPISHAQHTPHSDTYRPHTCALFLPSSHPPSFPFQ
jgi:hypothetical protein